MKCFQRSFSSVQQTSNVLRTHTVFNQSKPFINVNILESDPGLKRALDKFGGESYVKGKERISKFSEVCGSKEMMEVSRIAEANRPVLKQFDIYGNRIDSVEYVPAYHTLMKHGLENGVAAAGYNSTEKGSHVTRSALAYIENQLEPGHCCPITMTSACVPVLRRNDHCQDWLKKVLSQKYDSRDIPIEEKDGLTMGMSMTEKQGGSDVRANTTIARPQDPSKTGAGQAYEITGHKWFTSAPMCDGFLTLAKVNGADQPPSCFLLPRWKPDGTRNEGFKVMRLKDKLGDRANASSEVEYDNAWATMVGEEGKGVKCIIEMVQATRMDCCLGSSGSMRKALMVSLNHTNTRSAFGGTLSEQPLMQSLLTDLIVESEAATLMTFRMAAAQDAAEKGDEKAALLFRIGIAVTKYFVTKRSPHFTYECMEALGGNGFVEDYPLARTFRHSPLNSIWEGSGNVIVLDVLRGFQAVPVLLEEISLAKGMDSRFDHYLADLITTVKEMSKAGGGNVMCPENQRRGRNLVDRLAIAFQASVMLRFSEKEVAQAFVESRLHTPDYQQTGVNYGSYSFNPSMAEQIISNNMPVFY